MNTKAKGRRQDAKSKKLALEHGGVDATVSTASLGAFDIIAWGPGGIVFIQNKTNRPPDWFEQLQLMKAIVPRNAVKLILVWKDRVKFPDFYVVTDDLIQPYAEDEARRILEKTLR